MPGHPSYFADSKERASADICNCFAFSASKAHSDHVENYLCFMLEEIKEKFLVKGEQIKFELDIPG